VFLEVFKIKSRATRHAPKGKTKNGGLLTKVFLIYWIYMYPLSKGAARHEISARAPCRHRMFGGHGVSAARQGECAPSPPIADRVTHHARGSLRLRLPVFLGTSLTWLSTQ
jgi:hypothetical protein